MLIQLSLINILFYFLVALGIIFLPRWEDLVDDWGLNLLITKPQLFLFSFVCHKRQLIDHWKGITLRNKKSLSIHCIEHLSRVGWYKTVEESIKLVFLTVFPRFLSQDSAKSLSFLSSGTKMWRHLNNDICWWEIDSSISNSRKNDCIYCVCALEPTENSHLLIMRNITMNERSLKEFAKFINEKPIIWKDDDFVTPLFMILHQILTSHKLVWVANVHFRLFIVLSFSEISLEILVCHIALNFNALDSS